MRSGCSHASQFDRSSNWPGEDELNSAASQRQRSLLGSAALLIALESGAATYDVDQTVGNDSNTGASPTQPWKNAPGMAAYTGSGTLAPGDTVYFDSAGTWLVSGAHGICLAGGVTFVGNGWGSGTRATIRANELAAFCEAGGVDFERVRTAANRDGETERLLPGIGVGGHCTPVYPNFLIRESRKLGLPQRISEPVREINDGQRSRQMGRIAAAWRPLNERRVHILGLRFRPRVKLDTLSPAYALPEGLLRRGALVKIEDPYYSEAGLREAGFVPGTASDSEVVVLNTVHAEFAAPDFTGWRALGVETVLHGRNYWRQEEVEGNGLLYFGIGRSSRANPGASDRAETVGCGMVVAWSLTALSTPRRRENLARK